MWKKTDTVPAFMELTFLGVRAENLSLKGFACKQHILKLVN